MQIIITPPNLACKFNGTLWFKINSPKSLLKKRGHSRELGCWSVPPSSISSHLPQHFDNDTNVSTDSTNVILRLGNTRNQGF